MSSNAQRKLVVLGTGGTIAGAASNPSDNVGYTAGQRSVGDLLAAVPCRQVADGALAMLEAHQFTFQGLAGLLGKAQHGVNLLSTAIASYDGYRSRYLLCEANAVFHAISGTRSPPPFPTRNDSP